MVFPNFSMFIYTLMSTSWSPIRFSTGALLVPLGFSIKFFLVFVGNSLQSLYNNLLVASKQNSKFSLQLLLGFST